MTDQPLDKLLRDLSLNSPEFCEGMARELYRENRAHVRMVAAELETRREKNNDERGSAGVDVQRG